MPESVNYPIEHESSRAEKQENIQEQRRPNQDLTNQAVLKQVSDNQRLHDLRQQNIPLVENKIELERKAMLEKAHHGFEKLKSLLNSRDVPTQAKELLLSAAVSGVIAGIKPASYIQLRMARQLFGKWGRFGEGLIPKELEQFRDLLKEFNIESSIMKSEGADKFKKKMGVELVHIFRKEDVLNKMRETGFFSDEEMELAQNNMGFLFSEYLTTSNSIQEGARVGALYGYPPDDVRDYIQVTSLEKKLKTKGFQNIG